MYVPRVGNTEYRYYTAAQAKKRDSCCSSCCYWIMVVITLLLAVGTFSSYSAYKDISKSLGDVFIREPGLTPSPFYTGSVIHVAAPENTVKPKKAVSDEAFNVNSYGAFVMRREVEYCQWVEHQSTRTYKNSDGSEVTSTTYYYTKGWRPSRVSSVLFDQAAAHHNPIRDPYPAGIVDYTDVYVGNGYTIDRNLAKQVSVENEYYVGLNSEQMGEFMKSPAHLVDNFYYTSKDGWFYSPYTPSTAETLAKAALQYAEGTLFDFQVADLFSECTAGDIRVRFIVKTPKGGVSLIGRQVDDAGRISTFKSIDDRSMDVIYEGLHSANEVKGMKIDDAYNEFIGYLFCCIVSFVITAIVNCATSESEPEYKYKGY